MKRSLGIILGLAIGIVGTLAAVSAATPPNPDHKVTICHAHPADSVDGPWVEITVDVASVGYQHSGHQDEHDGDIIPPYSYTAKDGTVFTYDGKGDQEILANGCVTIEPSPSPSITPSPTESPSPSPTESPSPSVTLSPTDSPSPTETPTPTETHSPSPTPTRNVPHPPTNHGSPDASSVHDTAYTGSDTGGLILGAAILAAIGLGLLWLGRRNAR